MDPIKEMHDFTVAQEALVPPSVILTAAALAGGAAISIRGLVSLCNEKKNSAREKAFREQVPKVYHIDMTPYDRTKFRTVEEVEAAIKNDTTAWLRSIVNSDAGKSAIAKESEKYGIPTATILSKARLKYETGGRMDVIIFDTINQTDILYWAITDLYRIFTTKYAAYLDNYHCTLNRADSKPVQRIYIEYVLGE